MKNNDTDSNKRFPENPLDPKSGSGCVAEYGEVSGFRTRTGSFKITGTSLDPNKKLFEEDYNSMGYYTTSQDHEEGPLQTKFSNHERNYAAAGVTNNADSHTDNTTESTSHTASKGDSGSQTGGNTYSSTAGMEINVNQNSVNLSNGGSRSVKMDLSNGDKILNHTGNYHANYEDDHITSIKNNDMRMVSDGDHALHVQKGNYDVDIKGLARIFSEDEMLIESLTKITIKVGNSTIILRPDNIELDSPRIDLN